MADQAAGWLDSLEPGKNLVVGAPWELQLAKEMGTAAGLLGKRKEGVGKEESEEARYRNVRNLADAIVIFESQWKIRYQVAEVPDMQVRCFIRDGHTRYSATLPIRQSASPPHIALLASRHSAAAGGLAVRPREAQGENKVYRREVLAQAPAPPLDVCIQVAARGQVPPALRHAALALPERCQARPAAGATAFATRYRQDFSCSVVA